MLRSQMTFSVFFRIVVISIALVAFGVLSGCTSKAISTSNVESPETSIGIHYALPKGLVSIRLLQHKSIKNVFGLKFEGVSYIGDNEFLYLMSYAPSAFSSDIINVTKEVSASGSAGLLKKVAFTSEEQSAQVLLKVVELGKEVAKAPFVPFGSAGVVTAAEEDQFDAILYEGSFDPLSSNDVVRINKLLKSYVEKGAIFIEVDVPGRSRDQTELAEVGDCKWSICFRRPIAVDLVFRGETEEFQRISVVLPDKSKIAGLDIRRAALVKQVVSVEFENGMLQSLSATKPSEVLAGIQVPIDIAKAILSIPGEIVQLKIDTTKDSGALHQARLNELKAREQLIEFKAKTTANNLPE